MNKPRMLFVSVSPVASWSGTGNLADKLVRGMMDKYEIAVAGEGTDSDDYPCKIFLNSKEWWKFIDAWKPDILFLSHDVWRFPPVVEVRKKYPNLLIIGYFPIDVDVISKRWIEILDACDAIIVPSNFGRRAIRKRFVHKPVFVVREGVQKEFFLEGDKGKVKKEIAPQFSNKFVCFFVGMNQGKKAIGTILDGFDKFARNKEDVVLILIVHSTITNIFGAELITETDIGDMYPWRNSLKKIYMSTDILSLDDLIRVYFLSDVLLFPSQGEGFGLPVLEAIASKTVPIISAFSAMTEIPVFYFPLEFNLFKTRWNANRAIVSSDSLASVLEIAYNCWKKYPEEWQMIQHLNYEKAKVFTWERCVNGIVNVIEGMLKREIIDIELKRIV